LTEGYALNKYHLMLALARALQRCGIPADRLEARLTDVSEALGIKAAFFAAPTALFVTHTVDGHATTTLLDPQPGEVDLNRLAQLEEIAEALAHPAEPGDLTPGQVRRALTALERVEAAGPIYGRWVQLLAFAGTSAAAAPAFGGGWREMIAAFVVGAAVGELGRIMRGEAAALHTFISAAVAASIAMAFGYVMSPFSPQSVIIGGLIALLPGFTVTTATSELATGHLVAGGTRLLSGLLTLVLLGAGIAIASRTFGLAGPLPLEAPETLGPFLQYVCVIAASLAFVVLFNAAPRDAGAIAISGAVAFVVGTAGSDWLGPEMGALLGALAVGLLGAGYRILTGRPSTIPIVPGIMLLVPGSVGFRSVNNFLDGDAIAGVQSAFSMLLVAVCLTSGLLLARLVELRSTAAARRRAEPAPAPLLGG
jgi:uncharacterized membrane protein YjjP (DUF1212 family)